MSTDSLRPVIADILDSLAALTYSQQRPYVHGRSRCLRAGAATLRELHAEEGGLDDEEMAELDYLRSIVEGIEDRLTHLDGTTGKPLTAAAFRNDVKLLLAGVGL